MFNSRRGGKILLIAVSLALSGLMNPATEAQPEIVSSRPVAQLSGPQGAVPGEDVPALFAWEADPPVDKIAGAAAVPDGSSGIPRIRPLLVRDPAAYEAQKAAADLALPADEQVDAPGLDSSSQPADTAGADPVAPNAASLLNRRGLAANANSSVPPDTTGAIGPSDYVEVVNDEIAVYARGNLAQESRLSLNTFLGASSHDLVTDPQIQWDPVGRRWFYLALRVTAYMQRTERSFLTYGWSQTANPRDLTDGWCRFKTPSGTRNQPRLVDDFPKLGHADNHVIFGTNVFPSAETNGSPTSRIYAVSKPPAGSTGCGRPHVTRWGEPTRSKPPKVVCPHPGMGGVGLVPPSCPLLTSDGAQADTPVPAATIDSSANGYVVAAASTPGNQIMQWHISGPPTKPVLTADGNIAVPGYQMPPSVPQPAAPHKPGTKTKRLRLDTGQGQLTQAVAAVNPFAGQQLTIWTQHTVRDTNIPGLKGRSVARWYELIPATLTYHQLGTVQVAGQYVFNAAVSPSGGPTPHDDAAINYNVAGLRLHPQIRASSQEDFGTPNQMVGEITLANSQPIDPKFYCHGTATCRWGDYAGASPDPVLDDTVWGSNETLGGICGSDPCWRTNNFELRTGP